MKIARYQHHGREGVGVVLDDSIDPAGDDILSPKPGDEAKIRLSEIRLLPPVRLNTKIICVGLNYADHIKESGVAAPEEPLIFAKLPNSVVGPAEAIVLPSFSQEVDFEAELGVVIGRRAKAVSVDEARDYVYGYTCINDISARDLQFSDQQWTRGKSIDTFCPVGPWIVTKDEISDPQVLGIRCLLNDEPMQDSSTSEMIFDVNALISFISQGITLEPGDLIATGTPPGVGFSRNPPEYLTAGDVVRIEIDGIGYLENRVR